MSAGTRHTAPMPMRTRWRWHAGDSFLNDLVPVSRKRRPPSTSVTVRWLSWPPLHRRYPCSVLVSIAWSLILTFEYSPISSVVYLYGGPALAPGSGPPDPPPDPFEMAAAPDAVGAAMPTACPPVVAPAMLAAKSAARAGPIILRVTALFSRSHTRPTTDMRPS